MTYFQFLVVIALFFIAILNAAVVDSLRVGRKELIEAIKEAKK
jgi:hypothetical protein